MYRTEDHCGKWNKQDSQRLHFSLLWNLGEIGMKERQAEGSSLGMETGKGRGQEGLQRGERTLSILHVFMEMSQENPVIRTIN